MGVCAPTNVRRPTQTNWAAGDLLFDNQTHLVYAISSCKGCDASLKASSIVAVDAYTGAFKRCAEKSYCGRRLSPVLTLS